MQGEQGPTGQADILVDAAQREIELRILAAATELVAFELGSVAAGQGSLSLGRSSGWPDTHLRRILTGTRDLAALAIEQASGDKS